MVKLICKRCDQPVELNDNEPYSNCPVCGLLIENLSVPGNEKAARLVERIHLLLVEGAWEKAAECSCLLLNESPHNGYGYLYQYMATHHLRKFLRLGYDAEESLEDSLLIQHALEFGDPSLKARIEEQIDFQKKFQQLLNIRQAGKSYEDFDMLRCRRALEELWKQGDEKGAKNYLQAQLEQECQKLDDLLAEARQKLNSQDEWQTRGNDDAFDALVAQAHELATTKYLPAVNFVTQELPQICNQILMARFIAMPPLPDLLEPWADFYLHISERYEELTYLSQRGCKEARMSLENEFVELCYQRGCLEQRENNDDRASMMFRICGENRGDIQEHLAKIEQDARFDRVIKLVARKVIIIVVVLGVVVCLYSLFHNDVRFFIRKIQVEFGVKKAIYGKDFDVALRRLDDARGILDEKQMSELYGKLQEKLKSEAQAAMDKWDFAKSEKCISHLEGILGEDSSVVMELKTKQSRQMAKQKEQLNAEQVEPFLQFAREVVNDHNIQKSAEAVEKLMQAKQIAPNIKEIARLLSAFDQFNIPPGIKLYLVDYDEVIWRSEPISQKVWSFFMRRSLRDQAKKAFPVIAKSVLGEKGIRQEIRQSNKQDIDRIVGGKEGQDLPILWINPAEAEEFCQQLQQYARTNGGIPDGYCFQVDSLAGNMLYIRCQKNKVNY